MQVIGFDGSNTRNYIIRINGDLVYAELAREVGKIIVVSQLCEGFSVDNTNKLLNTSAVSIIRRG